jgi:hypothetical protein
MTTHDDEPFDRPAIWRNTALDELLPGWAPVRSIDDLAVERLSDEEAEAFIAAPSE